MTLPAGLLDLGPKTRPSAIGALLDSLTQQQQPTGQQAPPQQVPMPNIPAPTPVSQLAPPPQDNSVTGRIKSLLGGAAHEVGGLLGNLNPVPNAPPGFDQFLSPQEIQQARPGFLRSLLGEVLDPMGVSNVNPGNEYRNALMQDAANKMAGFQFGEQRAAARENQRLRNVRQQAAQLFPMPTNVTADNYRNIMAPYLSQLYNYYVANGDSEMAKDIGARMNDILKQPPAVKPTLADQMQARIQQLMAQNPRMTLQQASDKARLEFGQTLQPTPTQFTYPTMIDPNTNQPIIVKANTRTGEMTPTDFGGKTSGTAGAAGGALQMLAEGRMGFSYNDLKSTVADMTKLENDPAFRAKLTAWAKGKMAASTTQPNPEAKGALGAVDNLVGQFVAGKAGASLDPELRRYLLDRQRVGLAFTEAMPRPQQQLYHLEQGISGMDTGWDPASIASVQDRRQTGLQVLGSILRKQGLIDDNGNFIEQGKGGGKTGGKARLSPAQYQSLKTRGYTDADIKEKYQLPGGR